MFRRFESVLDECLELMSAGETLEGCLARYPQHAERLRAHLQLAQRLRAVPHQQPRAAVLAGTWQQFRTMADDMRRGRGRVRVAAPSVGRIGWMRPLTIAALLLLAVLGAGGGTVYASQSALPDSPLYRVKLATEDARVWFTFDDTGRAELLLNQSNERTDEIMELLRAGKAIPGSVLTAMRDRNARAIRMLEDHPDELALVARAREQSAEQEQLLLVLWGDVEESAQDEYAKTVATLHNAQLRTTGTPGSVTPDEVEAGVLSIAGPTEPLSEGVWLLGGVEVRLDSRTLGETELEPGQQVNVIAARGRDGRLLALSVTITDRGSQQQYFVSGPVEEINDNEVVIAGQRITITDRTLLKLRLQRGQQVEVKVEDVDGQAVASSVDSPSEIGGERAPALLAYEGIIEDEIGTEGVISDWVVGGQGFTVTPNTEIDARGGPVAQGARVRVEAIGNGDAMIARRVVVLPDDSSGNRIRVEGVLQSSEEAVWTVSGVQVEAPDDAETPEVGSLVTIVAQREGDRLAAENVPVVFEPGPNGLAQLRGSIGDIAEDGVWRMGLVSVELDTETFVRGRPQVGSEVFIWASRDEDGTLRAIHASVLGRGRQNDRDDD